MAHLHSSVYGTVPSVAFWPSDPLVLIPNDDNRPVCTAEDQVMQKPCQTISRMTPQQKQEACQMSAREFSEAYTLQYAGLPEKCALGIKMGDMCADVCK